MCRIRGQPLYGAVCGSVGNLGTPGIPNSPHTSALRDFNLFFTEKVISAQLVWSKTVVSAKTKNADSKVTRRNLVNGGSLSIASLGHLVSRAAGVFGRVTCGSLCANAGRFIFRVRFSAGCLSMGAKRLGAWGADHPVGYTTAYLGSARRHRIHHAGDFRVLTGGLGSGSSSEIRRAILRFRSSP